MTYAEIRQEQRNMMQAHRDLLALADQYALFSESQEVRTHTPNFIVTVMPSEGRNRLRYMTVTLRYAKHEMSFYGPEMAVIMFTPEALKILRTFVD